MASTRPNSCRRCVVTWSARHCCLWSSSPVRKIEPVSFGSSGSRGQHSKGAASCADGRQDDGRIQPGRVGTRSRASTENARRVSRRKSRGGNFAPGGPPCPKRSTSNHVATGLRVSGGRVYSTIEPNQFERGIMFSRGVVASSCIVLLAGCATLPDVTVSYYFPKAETQIAVTQTLSCW